MISHPEPSKLCELENRLAGLESRVTVLEGKRTPPEELEEVEFEAVRLPVGAEYWLGARLLPRLGAVIIVLAIAFIAISESAKNNALARRDPAVAAEDTTGNDHRRHGHAGDADGSRGRGTG